METPSASADALVVVCYYDARPVEPLLDLLRQMWTVPAGATFDVLVVVNSVTGTALALPEEFGDVEVRIRANQGFNIGAWQAAWQEAPAYPFYLFLQDECVLLREDWLRAFIDCAARPQSGFIGEWEVLNFTWRRLNRGWAQIGKSFEVLRREAGVPAGIAPLYLQTVVIGVRREVLMRSGGFITGEDKATAVAGEILSSVRLRSLGYSNRQVGFFPFTRVGHPQHAKVAAAARSLRWSLSRALRVSVARTLEAVGRLRPRR
jgi:hypothetical protein